jgi:hypothetical protein
MIQIPSIGLTVRYTLSASDAEQITQQRNTSESIATAVKNWAIATKAVVPVLLTDVQAHIGSEVAAGQTYPMMIVRVSEPTERALVNGQVFMDGYDVFWVRSVQVGEGPGTFAWPVRT